MSLKYTIITYLAVLFVLLLIDAMWGKEINAWLNIAVRDAKLKDLVIICAFMVIMHLLNMPKHPEN